MFTSRSIVVCMALCLLTNPWNMVLGASNPNDSTVPTMLLVAENALESNLAYQKSILNRQKIAQNLPKTFLFEKSNLSIEAGLDPLATDLSPRLKASVSVPILEQLNATASVDQNLATQFRLAFNPLLHSDSTRQALYSLDKALIQELRSKNDAVIAPLSLMIKVLNAQQSFVNSTKEAEISRIQHEESRIRYDKGIDTLASYRSAFRTATNAANALVRAEQNLAQQSNSLKQLIGKDQTAIVLAWGIQELEVLSSWLANKQANTSSAHHSSVELAYIDVKSAKSSLDSIWLLDPTVSLSFSLNANPATQASISSNLSASVSIGPQSWKQTERDFSQKNLALITQTWEQSKINAQQELELIKSNLALHEKTLILRTIAREEASEVLAETRLLFKSGRASELDVLDAELSFEQAVSDYLVALGEKINTQLSLLVFQN